MNHKNAVFETRVFSLLVVFVPEEGSVTSRYYSSA